MKYINYIISLLAVVVAVVIIVLFYQERLSFESTIVILLGEAISLIAILFHVKGEQIMEKTVVEKHIECQPQQPIQETEPFKEVVNNTDNSVQSKWSKAMYSRFAERWSDLFESIQYPAEPATKAEISVLSWEIASATMDYLMVDNDDQNTLGRHRNSVQAIIEGKKYADMELKEFYEDPSTVPACAITVNDTLKVNLQDNQSFPIQAFGHYIELTNKNE